MSNKKMFKKTEGKGLSLMELLLIALTLTVLSVIFLPQMAHTVQKAKQADCEANVDAINSAIEKYNADNGAYPATLADVIGTDRVRTAYFPDGPPKCPFGGTYIMDAEYKATCSHKFAQWLSR
jgi:competence protein ComGC